MSEPWDGEGAPGTGQEVLGLDPGLSSSCWVGGGDARASLGSTESEGEVEDIGGWEDERGQTCMVQLI